MRSDAYRGRSKHFLVVGVLDRVGIDNSIFFFNSARIRIMVSLYLRLKKYKYRIHQKDIMCILRYFRINELQCIVKYLLYRINFVERIDILAKTKLRI